MQPIVIKTLGLKIEDEVAQIWNAWTEHARELAQPGEEIHIYKVEELKLKQTSTLMQMAVKALPKEEKTWDQIVPPQYIHNNLEKGYICPSKSQYSLLFFFVGKKDGKLHPVVDCQKLNSFTIPDQYPLPLIQELVDKV